MAPSDWDALRKEHHDIPVDGFLVGGAFLEGALLSRDFRVSGIPLGTLGLLDAGEKPGDPVTGRLQAELYRMPE